VAIDIATLAPVHKVRYAAMGRGKSGGVRVIYYFYDADMPIYALLIYGKNERANLTREQMQKTEDEMTWLRRRSWRTHDLSPVL